MHSCRLVLCHLRKPMKDLWTWLGLGAAAAAASALIFFQNTEIANLKEVRTLLQKEISDLEGQLKESIAEKIRTGKELEEYRNKKAEIEIRYLTKEVPVFREIVKTVPPATVETTAKEEINEAYRNITNRAIDFSLRNTQD